VCVCLRLVKRTHLLGFLPRLFDFLARVLARHCFDVFRNVECGAPARVSHANNPGARDEVESILSMIVEDHRGGGLQLMSMGSPLFLEVRACWCTVVSGLVCSALV
jgi:hypothetical protein